MAKLRAFIVIAAAIAVLPAYADGGTKLDRQKAFVVEYYYKVRWGFSSEFIRLFKKNHYPILKKQMDENRILSIKAESPFYHSTEDSRWDYRVTVAWNSATVAHDEYDGIAQRKILFPDEEVFKREEQRRFELMLSHWDVVVEPVDLERQ